MKLLENKEWVARLTADDGCRNEAIGELRTILIRGLNATCGDRLGGKLQVDDVVQDALIKILDKLDTFEGRSKFTTWAMTITIRTAYSALRRRHFRDVSIESLSSDSMQFEPIAVAEDTDNKESQTMILRKLKELIKTSLTEKQRNATYCSLNGMPAEVFAEKTGSTRNAVYKLLHDARSKLRRGFEHAGFEARDIQAAF